MKTQRIIKLMIIWLAVISTSLISCSTGPNNSSQVDLPDGTYLLLNEHFTQESRDSAKGFVVEYSHDFLDENEKGLSKWIEIDTSEYVPLTLAKKPEGVEQPDKRINLLLTLTNDAKEKLADFTEKHVNKRVAIVIGGKAVTQHVVRTRIEGGKLQITRCTDNACEFLYLELQDAVVE